MAGKDPIDPNVGPRFVLAGDVVTMDDHLTVVPDGRIYVDSGVHHGGAARGGAAAGRLRERQAAAEQGHDLSRA